MSKIHEAQKLDSDEALIQEFVTLLELDKLKNDYHFTITKIDVVRA